MNFLKTILLGFGLLATPILLHANDFATGFATGLVPGVGQVIVGFDLGIKYKTLNSTEFQSKASNEITGHALGVATYIALVASLYIKVGSLPAEAVGILLPLFILDQLHIKHTENLQT